MAYVISVSYVIAPELLPEGSVVILNGASPYAFVSVTANVLAANVDAPSETVRVVLVLVPLVY
jgi:hypothetical protein